jgi:hypothetical protein
VSLEIFTKKGNTSSTIEAVTAELGVVCANSISDFETLNILPNCRDFTYGLVSRDQGELSLAMEMTEIPLR